jgi:hypothetical protein
VRAAAEWVDREWANLLAVIEAGDNADEEVVTLAQLAASVSDGVRH